jgi:hypothetical protein
MKYNEYWQKNIKLFKVGDFKAELTMHILPRHKHLIRYYGLYFSRTKGKAAKDGSLTKFGCKAVPRKKPAQASDPEMESVSSKASMKRWARLIQKVYGSDPLLCPKCGHEMRVIVIITDPGECKTHSK